MASDTHDAPSESAPEHGPRHNGKSAPELATAAEEALRGIVHLAEANERPLDAQAIYHTLSGTTRMLEHLPEVITRLRAAVVHQHEAGKVSIKAGRYTGDPDAAVQALTEAIDAVLAGFGSVRTNMEKAQATLSDAAFAGGADDHLA